jgi:hypothetical protein
LTLRNLRSGNDCSGPERRLRAITLIFNPEINAARVWVCDFLSTLPLAAALRQGLVTAAMARLAETGKAGKMEELYNYLCGVEFRQHVEAVVESFVAMQQDLQKERRATEKAWAAREKQLGRALLHTAQLYGGIQGIAGQTALPEIKTLELPAGEAPAGTPEPDAP